MTCVGNREFKWKSIPLVYQYNVPGWNKFNSVDPRPLFGLHLVELSPENNSSPYPYRYERPSEYTHLSRPPRHCQIAVGFLLLGAATATVFMALKGAEYTDYYWPALWWAPLLSGMTLAAWIANHALGYFL